MAAAFTRGRLSRMLPLLSITSPMLTGMSSRLKTESFCSTLSSKTRKLSCFRPSANFPRSSITVVCSTTRLTSTRILLSWLDGWFGGGGCAGAVGSCAADGATLHRRTHTTTKAKRTGVNLRAALMAWGVIASLRVNVERRKPFWRAQLDLDLSPARIVCFVTWAISEDILISQLHADFRRDIRQFVQILDGENAA